MKTLNRLPRIGALLFVLSLIVSGCAQASGTAATRGAGSPQPAGASAQPPAGGGNVLHSNIARIVAPAVPADDLKQLARGNNAFAVSLYRQLRGGEGNLFYSPYSISLALAMGYAGAKGTTESQMASALHFTLPQDRLHPAFNALDQIIASYEQSVKDPQTKTDQGFQLALANSIWGQQGFPFLPAYLDLLALNYGAGMNAVDFINAPDPSRKTINDWVKQQTHEKITDLLPEGSIDSLTRLVLANAIYFKASWANPFDPALTANKPFYLTGGGTGSVPMMNASAPGIFQYSQGAGFQAIGLPYNGGNVMMAILMPAAGSFSGFETGLTDTQLESILTGMSPKQLILTMPKFGIKSVVDLNSTLSALGMGDAFDKTNADFSGIDGEKDLYFSSVLHGAFVSVDENGTEAAAATLVVMRIGSGPTPPLAVTIDHPFLFVIYDPQTDTILFMGRVMDPAK